MRRGRRLLDGQSGQGIAEYALIGGFVFLAVIAVLTGVGQNIANKLGLLSNGLQ